MARRDDKFTKEIRCRVEQWRNYFRENINKYHWMHEFVYGCQWDHEESCLLKTYKKVPLQFNKLATLVNTLLGEQQQNTPQLEVVPLSDADEETAQIREMVVKDLMLSTDAKKVYQIAASQAFVGGFGAFFVETSYSHEKSFDLDINYRSLKDPTRAYFDVSAQHTNKIDGMYCGHITRISRKRFRAQYGNKIESKISKHAFAATEETSSDNFELSFNWSDEHSIAIVNAFEREFKSETLYKLSNGDVFNKKEMDDLVEKSLAINREIVESQMQMIADGRALGVIAEEDNIEEMFPIEPIPDDPDPEQITLYHNGEPIRIEDKRETKKSVIKHYVIAGDFILDENEFPSEDLPGIFVDQNSYYDKDGKQICRPFVVDAVDTQRFINYLGTQIAFLLKISRYDQFIGSKNNVKSNDTQRNWRDPQNVQGMLIYDESPSGAKPEQLRPPEISASLVQQYNRAIEDLYTCTGLYPTRLGQQGNEISGAAIDARTRQGSYPTYTAFNSVNRAITAGGTIVNQMIPRVYDTERVLSLMTPDKGRQNVVVNKMQDDFTDTTKNDLTKGTFEVRLQAGPSYEGQKEQALESLNMVLKASPQLLNLIADLYAENLPLSNTIEIKNRLKTIVPPEILQAGKSGQMPPEKQMPSAQDQAIMAEIKLKQEELELKKQELQLKMEEVKIKNEIAMHQLERQKLETLGKLESEKLRYLAETDRTASDNAIAHADNLTKILTKKME